MEIQVGKIYRHFKGNYYYIQEVALDSETKERMVIYKPLYERKDSKVWVRREAMFFEEVPLDRPDNITGQKMRFELCEDLNKDIAGASK